MSIFTATKDGYWTDPTVWDLGEVPGNTDDVYANGYSITIDLSNLTVQSLNYGDGITDPFPGPAGEYILVPDANDSIEIITTSALAPDDSPEPHDVRKGVIYGDKTGTLAVPNPLEVAFGIPTDNTVGQAAISLVQLSGITGEQIAAAFEK